MKKNGKGKREIAGRDWKVWYKVSVEELSQEVWKDMYKRRKYNSREV